MANTRKTINVKVDIEYLAIEYLANRLDACYGNIAYVTLGVGEIHIDQASGPAPKNGQRVIIIPIEDDSIMETPEISL